MWPLAHIFDHTLLWCNCCRWCFCFACRKFRFLNPCRCNNFCFCIFSVKYFGFLLCYLFQILIDFAFDHQLALHCSYLFKHAFVEIQCIKIDFLLFKIIHSVLFVFDRQNKFVFLYKMLKKNYCVQTFVMTIEDSLGFCCISTRTSSGILNVATNLFLFLSFVCTSYVSIFHYDIKNRRSSCYRVEQRDSHKTDCSGFGIKKCLDYNCWFTMIQHCFLLFARKTRHQLCSFYVFCSCSFLLHLHVCRHAQNNLHQVLFGFSSWLSLLLD